MKFKFIFFTVLLLITTVKTVAQISDLNWSNPLEKTSDQTFKKALVDDQKYIYIIKTSEANKGTIYVDIIDSTGKSNGQSAIDISCDKIEDCAIINEKLCVFATSFNTKEQIDILSIFQISRAGELSSTLPLMKMKANGGYHSLFDAAVSPNKKHISIVCTHPYKENHSEELTMNLYSSDFTQVKSTHLSTSIPGHKKRTTISALNDNGFVYILKKHRLKTKTFYDIFTIDSHGHHHHTNINAKSKKIADMGFGLNKKGALIIAGFYSAPNRKNFEGVFALEYKESVHPSWTKSFLLNENIVTTFKTKKEINSYGYGLDRFHVKNLVISGNGDIVLTAEHRGLLQDKKLGTMDYRKGMVVAKLNKSGGMKGVVAIQLDQKDAKDSGYFSSHSLLVNSDQTFVISNKIGPNNKIKAPKNTGASVHIEQSKISDEMSNITTFPTFNPDFSDYLLQPAIQISNDQTQLIILESSNNIKYKVGFIFISEE